MATDPAHLALAVDVINPRDVGHGEGSEQPDNPDYPWHFLAEGDSWFTIAAIPSSNLLLELRLGRLDSGRQQTNQAQVLPLGAGETGTFVQERIVLQASAAGNDRQVRLAGHRVATLLETLHEQLTTGNVQRLTS